MKHCCDTMQTQALSRCSQHSEIFICPDNLIYYSEKFDEYGIVIQDGGSSSVLILYCPWCGTHLPKSKRDKWFEELEALGFDNPFEQDIPTQYKTGEWYRV